MNKSRQPSSSAPLRSSVPDQSYSDLNPYAGFDTSSQLSFWNKFTDALGFTNNAGKLYAENELNARNWETEYQLLLQDREYNDYASQVERMRSSGLNPDFQNVSAGDSSLSSAANAPQSRQAAGMLGNAENFVSGLSQVMTGVIGLVTGINGIQVQNLSADLGIFSTLKDTLFDVNSGQIADEILKGTDEEVEKFINTRGKDTFGSKLDSMVNWYSLPKFMSKRNEKFVNSLLGQMFTSSDFRDSVISKVSNRYRASKDAAESFGNFAGGFVSGFEGENGDATGLTQVMSILAEAGYKAMKLETSAREKKGKYDTDFYTTLQGSSIAGAMNAESNLNEDKNATTNKLRSVYDEMVDNLAKASRDKNASWLERNAASGALILLYMLSSGSINMSRSNGPKGVSSVLGFNL